MRTPADYTGIITTGSDYPLGGTIKNDPNGTRVDESVFGDMVQFFLEITDMAALTGAINHLPDNVTNGYQLVEALMAVTRSKWVVQTIATLAGSTLDFTANSIVNITNPLGSINAVVLGDPIDVISGNTIVGAVAGTAGQTLSFSASGSIFLLTGTSSLKVRYTGSVYFRATCIDASAAVFTLEIWNPPTDVPWTNIPVDPSWSAGGVVPQYRVDSGRVQLRGNFTAGATPGSTLGTIPVAGRPTYAMIVPAFLSIADTVVGITINPSGVIQFSGATVAQNLFIDGITFTID